jgi:hypothetical protein
MEKQGFIREKKEEKKGEKIKEWKKIKKYVSFYANKSEIKDAYFFTCL